MSEISAFDIASPSAATGSARAKGFSSLTSEQFAKIIFSELSNQDPLQPNDTNALLQQVSTLRDIQANTDLTDQLGTLVKQDQFSAAATLLGRQVSGISIDNQRVAGTVKSISRTNEGPIITLDSGSRVNMSNLDIVTGLPASDSPAD